MQPITLPPTIKPGRSLPELNQAINVWTRQATETIKNLSDAISSAGAGNIPIANATTTGLLSFTDWTVFNNKQPAGAYLLDAPTDGTIYGRKNGTWVAAGGSSGVPTGNLTESTSSVLTITGGTNAVVGSGVTVQVQKASSTLSGYLSATDWNSFNAKYTNGNALTINYNNTLTIGTASTSGQLGVQMINTIPTYAVYPGLQLTVGSISSGFSPGGNSLLLGLNPLTGLMSIWVGGSQCVTSRQGGWASPSGTLTRGSLNTGTATLAQVAQVLGALITDLITHGLLGP